MIRSFRPRPLDVVIALSGWFTVLLALTTHGPVRAIVVFAFLYLGPGLAVARRIGLTDRLERLVLAVAISVAISTMITSFLAIAHAQTTATGLSVVAFVTSVVVGWPRLVGRHVPENGVVESTR